MNYKNKMMTTNREANCWKCGKPIPEERLKILPTTTTCVNCSTVRPVPSSDVLDVAVSQNVEGVEKADRISTVEQ